MEYCCAEQFMMAEKARMFHDDEMLEKILTACSPKEMKAYGRAVRNFDQEQWEAACFDIVKRGNLAKFSQNPHLWAFLKTTRKRIIVEASPRDRIWGIGMGKSNPDAEIPVKWRGSNLLGFALTEVSDQLLVMEDEEENYRKLPQKELRLLLIQRGGHPYLGDWALPGGFVRPGETAMEAAGRELREETGLEDVYLEQLYTFSDPKRDPRTWVMSCSHMALADSAKVQLKAGDDADNALWFTLTCRQLDGHSGRCRLELVNGDIRLACTIEEKIEKAPWDAETGYKILENDGLAFDHEKIIYYALNRLRGKLDYTDLALHLMSEEFSNRQVFSKIVVR